MDMECYLDKIDKKIDGEFVKAVPLGVGSKIETDGETLKILQEDKYIKENFKLNILKLSDNWYSVYFDDINK